MKKILFLIGAKDNSIDIFRVGGARIVSVTVPHTDGLLLRKVYLLVDGKGGFEHLSESEKLLWKHRYNSLLELLKELKTLNSDVEKVQYEEDVFEIDQDRTHALKLIEIPMPPIVKVKR